LAFPPSFLYHQSWEDPDVDAPVLDIKPTDTCLTLTSGGCNTLNLLLQGARRVVSVDINPAQTALLELKTAAIINLNYEDFWLMFGEGCHPDFPAIFAAKLAPYLTQKSREFWERRLHYFRGTADGGGGLYSQGSMGAISVFVRKAAKLLGMSGAIDELTNAQSLDHQRAIFNKTVAQFATFGGMVTWLVKILFLNRFVAWFAAGVPKAQLDLIAADGVDIVDYCKRVLKGVFNSSYIRGHNYFYYNILTGRYTPDNCPAYLRPDNFRALKGGLIYNLRIVNDFFLNALAQGNDGRPYDKVILMDHADWQTSAQTIELARTLNKYTSSNATIIFRSAASNPPYVEHLRAAGFEVTCLSRIDNSQKSYIDRVNMYASFWVISKKI
jgi:betaine lipid synthase